MHRIGTTLRQKRRRAFQIRWIHRFPGSGFKLSKPLKVRIFKDPPFQGFLAVAPALGMWNDGMGKTPSLALADLRESILINRKSIGKAANKKLHAFALRQKQLYLKTLVPNRNKRSN